MLLDGQHTGRYRWEQLHKTEKTHAGTLVEIALARALRLADGTTLDYTIAGTDVDCKFSYRRGGWMIPPEADGKLLLLVQASDEDGTWSAGLLRATPENLSSRGQPGRQAHAQRPRPRGGALAARPRPAAGERADPAAASGCGGHLRAAFGAAAGERAVPARAADEGQPDRGGHGRDAGRLHEAGPRRRRGARPAARRGHRDLRGLRRGPGCSPRRWACPARGPASSSAPGSSRGRASPGIMAVRSVWRAPTGGSPRPPIRRHLRPRCPANLGDRVPAQRGDRQTAARPGKRPPPASAGQATPDSAETLALPSANRNRMACPLTQGQMSKGDTSREYRGGGQAPMTRSGQISRIGEGI